MSHLLDPAFELATVAAKAEKELGAFLAAVTEVLGEAQAAQAAELWLSNLEQMEWPGEQADVFFRDVTIQTVSVLTNVPKDQQIGTN